MRKELDFLSVDFLYGINSIPSKADPGLTAFAVTFFRANAFTLLVVFALYFVKYRSISNYTFSSVEVIFFSTIVIFFEEQGRWIFSSQSLSPKKSCALFALLLISLESIGFLMSGRVALQEFFAFRGGSICVHSLNAYICALSVESSFSKKILFFGLAVAFHLFMNSYGSNALFLLLSS